MPCPPAAVSIGGSGRVISDKGLSIREALERRNVSLLVSPTDSVADALAVMARASVTVACAGATSAESHDRASLRLDQHDFVQSLAAAPRSVPLAVAMMAPGAVAMPWAALVDGAAALFLAGQGTGDAWAAVLTAEVNPSGRLPLTLRLEEVSPKPCDRPSPFRWLGPTVAEYLALGTTRCAYNEGLHSGWRGLVGKSVAFPFGHGISYTRFTCTRRRRSKPTNPPPGANPRSARFSPTA